MGRRRQGREIALQALYIADTSRTPLEEALRIVGRRRPEGDDADEATIAFAHDLTRGTLERIGELDAIIEKIAKNWTIARMAAVDRTMLRLAAYELLFQKDTPVGVIIDEAIEIVRKYSGEDSTRFINGILDKIKDRREDGDGSKEGSR